MGDSTLDVDPGITAPAPGGTIPISIPIDLPARIHRNAEGSLRADVPARPGCMAGGGTLDELLGNLRKAAEGRLLAKQDIETVGWRRP